MQERQSSPATIKKAQLTPCLAGKVVKSVKLFTYLSSNITSAEADVKIRISKAWSTLDGLNIIWNEIITPRENQTWFLPSSSRNNVGIWLNILDSHEETWSLARWHVYRNASSHTNHLVENASKKETPVWRTPTNKYNYYRKPHQNNRSFVEDQAKTRQRNLALDTSLWPHQHRPSNAILFSLSSFKNAFSILI